MSSFIFVGVASSPNVLFLQTVVSQAEPPGQVNDEVDMPPGAGLALLFPPIVLLGFWFFFLAKQINRVKEAHRLAKENTDAIARNNDLLQENIALQKEILAELRKRSLGS